MLRTALTAGFLVLASTLSQAAEFGCGAFKQDVSAARALLGQEGQQTERGQEVKLLSPAALELDLTSLDAVTPPLRPDRLPSGGEHVVGWVTLTDVAPGHVQVALSAEGWIDLIEDGRALKAADFTGAKDCPGIRKVVSFTVRQSKVTVQVTAQRVQHLRVAVRQP